MPTPRGATATYLELLTPRARYSTPCLFASSHLPKKPHRLLFLAALAPAFSPAVKLDSAAASAKARAEDVNVREQGRGAAAAARARIDGRVVRRDIIVCVCVQ